MKAHPSFIQIRGARQNNLKGIDLDLPLGALTVICGASGSGKSSLAFDTLYAEGQRRYVETFSPYTRQFLERMDKPKVDAILGIPPAIAIEQANAIRTTRSTVGTMTEINDYLKLLFPRLAKGRCPKCERPIAPESAASIVADTFRANPGATLLVTFGVPVPEGTRPEDFFAFLQQQGYLRCWLDGKPVRVDEPYAGQLPPVVPVIADRLTVEKANRARFGEAVETALRFGRGKLMLIEPGAKEPLRPHSTGWHCAHCDLDITPPSAGLFSFNHPQGACPTCRGFGRVIGLDLDRALPDKSLSIKEGVVKPFQTENGQECQRDLLKGCARHKIAIDTPFHRLSAKAKAFVLYGEAPELPAETLWTSGRWYGVRGFFTWLESKAYKMHVRVLLSRYRNYTLCNDCHGGRFQPATLNYHFDGRTLPELAGLPVASLLDLLQKSDVIPDDATTVMLRGEVETRLRYLVEVGLGYLSLDRATKTLSGGEVERVNLTSCLGASLVNTLFVMDEPTVGLHPRDVDRLLKVMFELRDRGNTLVVVEHEEAVLRAADHFVEIGPGRGEGGGELVYSGPPEKIGATLTGDYLSGARSIALPARRRQPTGWLNIEGATHYNLREVDVALPLGLFACVTGVSGSGKSTLVHDILYHHLARGEEESLSGSEGGTCRAIHGAEAITQSVMVDQSPLSRTPRSTPALFLGIFDAIREEFAMQPSALSLGLTASAFSFNTGPGRCDRCNGMGFEKVEMQFLSDLFVRCPECEGRRYQDHVLSVKVRDYSMADVLEMTVDEAIPFYEAAPPTSKASRRELTAALRLLAEVGLGYLRLGQPLNVLSGGEAQRLKLVRHLTEQKGNGALLILDEPTTGLHFDDVAMLLRLFERLVEAGNSLLVIEHNLEVIKACDYIVDLGPEAGAGGGLVIATGTPEEVAASAAATGSHTGAFLAPLLQKRRRRRAIIPARVERQVQLPVMSIHGAREHNLKNLSLDLPRDRMVVITGLSGSGKSTLAFDILFAEGQRRFLDSMSPYARQFMEALEKPDVDLVSGLPPTVAIEQRVTRGGGKSTVATVTEVYHFLRLLYAKLGTQYCPECEVPVEKQSFASLLKKAQTLVRKKGSVRILAPLIKARKGFHSEVAKWAAKEGFEELLIDGSLVRVADFKKLERYREHTIDVVVGERHSSSRLEQVLRRALEIGKGTARLLDSEQKLTVLSSEMSCPGCGLSFEELDPRLFSFNSPHGWCETCHGFGEVWEGPEPEAESVLEAELQQERRHEWLEEGEARPCETCHGARLNRNARYVRLHGGSITDFSSLPVCEALSQLTQWRFSGAQKVIATDILPEIRQRLEFMGRVGLDYLSLDRSAKTLSGGESQRIRLAAQLGSNLRGVLYVLDEPTIGLHPRDNAFLLDTLEALREKGNSLVIVEHDEETMRRADTIVDLGPAAGVHGGEVVAIGKLDEILRHPESQTARCLREPIRHPSRGSRRPLNHDVPGWVELKGARANNLQSVDVRFPLGRLSVITGISGSGKSTLMRRVLKPALTQPQKKGDKTLFESVRGAEGVETVYEVDQTPIGKTSRSTPATYIKVFDEIRKQFAQVPLARMRGYTPSRFSFNTEGGRCEACAGQGVIKIEMNFLPPSYIPCSDCHGKRYNPATLEVLYNERSIGDVMEMNLDQAAAFFASNPKIARPLDLLCETGLGYLKLGQPSPTLSGGEAQRLKLVSELSRGVTRRANDRLRRQREPKSTLYLLEEPTIGLHMADVERLLDLLHRLVDDGQTVIVIEHNMSLAADADYIIDIGPEAGPQGGQLVACGTPEEVATHRVSRTAPFLKAQLALTPASPTPPRTDRHPAKAKGGKGKQRQ